MPTGRSTDGRGNGSTNGNIPGDGGDGGSGKGVQFRGPCACVTPPRREVAMSAPAPAAAPAIAFKNVRLSLTQVSSRRSLVTLSPTHRAGVNGVVGRFRFRLTA